jgi:hypothetical protein
MDATFLLDLFRDVLLGPVWVLTGVDKDSLAGLVVQGIAGAAVTAFVGWLGFLALQTARALRRASDARAIAQARQAAPNAVLILIADFAGEGKKAKWGDEGKKAKWGDALNARLAEDFAVFAPGAVVRTARWTKRYKGKGAAKRARADAAANAADLILWGADVRGDEVQIQLATADAARAAVLLAFGGAKTRAEGTGRLSQEVGDAIAFFAAQAAGQAPADLNALKAVALTALAEKLAGLLAAPPKGLTDAQRAVIAASFDPIGFAAVQRAFPSDAVHETLLAARKTQAQASGKTADWLAWAEVGKITGVAAAKTEARNLLPKLAAAEADPAQKAAALALLANAANNDSDQPAAIEAARAALALNPQAPVVARSQAALALALSTLGLNTPGSAGFDLIDQARAAGAAAMQAADPADLLVWLSAHLEAAQSARLAVGRGDLASVATLRAEAEAALDAALAPPGRPALPDAPKAIVLCAIERGSLLTAVTPYAPAGARIALLEEQLKAVVGARGLIPAGRAPSFAADLAREAGRALHRLGKLENSPMRLVAAIKASAEAAALDAYDPPSASSNWADVALARILLGKALLSQPGQTAAQTAQARTDAAKEAALAIDVLTTRVAPHWTRSANPQGVALLQERLGLAHRLRAELADAAPAAAAAYRTAAGHFRAAAEAHAALGDAHFAALNARVAAECENLALGEAQAGG